MSESQYQKQSVIKCSKCQWLTIRWQNLLTSGWLNTSSGWLCPDHKAAINEAREAFEEDK